MWGELSSECGASRLGVSFPWLELSLGELSLGRVVLFPFKLFRIAKYRKYRENVGCSYCTCIIIFNVYGKMFSSAFVITSWYQISNNFDNVFHYTK